MKALRKYSHVGLTLTLGAGILLALVLSVQCVRTYLYLGRVLIPQAAEQEADRQGGLLVSATRSAGVTDPKEVGPVLEQAAEDASNRVVWMRVLNQQNAVLAQAGTPQGEPKVPERWWERVEKHESLGRVIDTPRGKALVTLLPFRMPRPSRAGPGEPQGRPPGAGGPPRQGDRRAAALVLEIAIQLDSVSGAFTGLRRNLVSGMLASLALVAAMAVIGLRAPRYLRGKYLEKELELARHVQSDLLPKAVSVIPNVEFAAAAVAADHVGGDFHDIFETDSGKIAMVLGDVSGKGVSAALLVSVLQGAIRSSSASQHETSCERINRMLCEKTATERFATLFWGIFDPLTATLRYVNAGHAAPLLMRASSPGSAPERLDEGGPVLGILPSARYAAGLVKVEAGDTLVLYSDGINEASNAKREEFGDDRVLQIVSGNPARPAQEICGQIMDQVAAFVTPGSAQDDRTLMVVRFLSSRAAMTA